MFTEPTWAILELMGHRRIGGKVSEVEVFGSKMCRIDIPSATDPNALYATQLYGGSSIYCVSPCTEEAARAVAKLAQPEPVKAWELPARTESSKVCDRCGQVPQACYCEDDDGGPI